MLSAAALSYAAHAAPAAAPAASAEPASGTMVMTARETPEAACARGEAAACTVAALRVLPSVDKARSEQKAVGEARALFEKGCRGGDPESCRHLGLLLAEGRIYSADLPAAKELLSRGCTIGDDRSCREMARIANDAGEHEALVSWLGKSCMLGNETSCMRTATLDRSDDRVRWVEEACRLGRMDACLDAAERRQNGNGVPVDMKLAPSELPGRLPPEQRPVVLPRRQDPALWRRRQGRSEGRRRLVRQGCQMRQTRACAILGDLYLSGEGVDKDDVRARLYHNIACSSGLRSSCPKAGR